MKKVMVVFGTRPEAISLGVSVGSEVIVYAVLVTVFKGEEIDMLIDMIKKKIKRVWNQNTL